jgi:large repetitive protein
VLWVGSVMITGMLIARLVGACLFLLLAGVNGADAQLRVQPFISGLSMPVAIVPDPRDSTVHFVVQQDGRIRVVKNGVLQAADFLDITGPVLFSGEQGLFSLVFPPDAATNDRFWVNFTRKPDGATVVARFLRSGDPLVADPTSRVDLMWPGETPGSRQAFIDQPFANHNGGHMAFGPDGFLYIGMGDGGSGNDPDHRAQNPQSLLGKMLRIDVNVPDANANAYVVPPSNPFVDNQPITALTEIWAFGMRNPWRFSFDDVARGGTGALVIADVGQNAFEEIDYEPAGQGGRNYGWRNREGKHATPGIPATPGPAYTPLTDPIFEYSHDGGGASITGGYVYRGSALGPNFVGRYFFADFVLGRQWSLALTVNPTTHEATASDLRDHTAEFGAVGGVSSFGVDAAGELFVVDYGGTIYRVLPQEPPNLRVIAVSAPATGVASGTINVTNRIKNVGGVTAVGPFRVGIYLSAGDDTPGAGTLIGSRTVASLAGGAESAATTAVTLPAGTAAGSYFVSAVVDIDGTVDESHEDDNGLTATTKVDVIRPDLVMQSVSGPTRGAVGQPISVTTSVKNIGQLGAGAFTIGIYFSPTNTPGSGTRIATRSVASLAPGATTTAVTSANIPPGTTPGTYFLSAVADDAQVVPEIGDAANGTNGANNAAVATPPLQVVSLLPDLEISAISAPSKIGFGQPMTVAFTVRNSGLTTAGPFRVRFYLAPDAPPPGPGDGVAIGLRTFTGLAAGASLPTSVSLTVPANLSVISPGSPIYFVSAVADADNQVAEIVEGVIANGRMSSEILLIRPDLEIARLETRASPAVVKAARGGTLVLRNVTVKNTATAPGHAPASTLKFYLSDDQAQGAGDLELTPVVSVPALGPGASFTVAPTLPIPASVTTGAKFIIARAILPGSLSEISTANNTAAIPVDVGDFADLQITAVAGPAAAGTGLPMTVTFTTKNAGTAPVGPFRVNLFMAAGPNASPLPGDGTGVGFKDFPGLAAGASLASTLVVNVPASLAAGSYFVSAVADAGNAIPEAGGNDGFAANGRVAVKMVTVIRPDLVVSALTAPVRAARGGTVPVTATVKNVAAAPASAPVSSLKFYLSDDQTLDGADVELSRARAIPILGPGAVSTATTTLAIPASVTTGSKFILARADALDLVTEAQEGNNVAAWPIEIGDFVDLQMTAVAGPVAAGTGRPMTVSFTTRNAGSAPVGPFRVNLFLAPVPNPAPQPGDGIGVGFKDFPGLAAGASVPATLPIDLPASFVAGSYFLSAVADAGNAIPETNGNDGVTLNGRVAAKTITVVRPDLVVSALAGPIRAARGGIAAMTATVKNLAASPASAPASSLKFYLSDDQTLDGGDVELAPARAVPILGPGGVSTAVTTLTIPPSVTTGSKFILARADAADQVIEADEGNNVTAWPIEIGDFADLQITAVAGPATVRAGQNMTVSFTVKNAGTAPVGAFNVTLYLAPSAPPPAPGDGNAVGLKPIASLGTLASLATTVVVSVPDDLAPGVYALSAVADADGVIPELGGSDGAAVNGRLATKTITVQPPL